MDRTIFLTSAVTVGAVILFASSLDDIFYIPPDHPAIQYGARPSNDPVALLAEKMESRKVRLEPAPEGWGYLPSILKELGIGADSQVLVFSKTSIQSEHIGPAAPRAIYFSENASVGFVQGGKLELSGLDPQRGVYFYTLDSGSVAPPQFVRDDSCLRCHQGPATLGVPGLMISSIRPRTEGAGEGHGNSYITDDRVRLADRWGGWYVTGTTGSQTNLGNNANLVDPLHPGGPMEEGTQNITSLAKFFNISRYLVPTSDLVALMTLEHQTRMTNLMTRIGWDARIALHDHGGKLDEAAQRKIDSEIEEMLVYMLFVDEAPLKGPVAGISTFAKTFAARGPKDRQGRSLRDFDLQARLFKYPLSYMIYSAAFDGMPRIVRNRVYRRLFEILSAKESGKPFDRLSIADRQAVLEIVSETKANLPSYWPTQFHQSSRKL